MNRRKLLGALGATGLFGLGGRAAAQPRSPRPFNGLSTGVSDLYRLSAARTRSISPENFTGAKGEGGRATAGTGAESARDLGTGWKISPSVRIPAKETFTLADITGPGRHSAHLADADGALAFLDPARLLGRRDDAVDRGAGRRLLRVGVGEVRAGELARGRGESRKRLQQLLGDAVPQVVPHHAREHRGRPDDGVLPGDLRAHRGARRRRLPARAVPPGESAAVQEGLHDRRGHQGGGPLRRHAHGDRREQQRLVGRGRDQVLHGRRRSSRRSAGRAPKTTSAARTTSRTGRRIATRSSRRPTPGCRS